MSKHIRSSDFFDLLDDYTGPEELRAAYLAGQWTCWGDDEPSEYEWACMLTDAQAVICDWRGARLDTTLAALRQSADSCLEGV